jgi:hypothetical protein
MRLTPSTRLERGLVCCPQHGANVAGGSVRVTAANQKERVRAGRPMRAGGGGVGRAGPSAGSPPSTPSRSPSQDVSSPAAPTNRSWPVTPLIGQSPGGRPKTRRPGVGQSAARNAAPHCTGRASRLSQLDLRALQVWPGCAGRASPRLSPAREPGQRRRRRRLDLVRLNSAVQRGCIRGCIDKPLASRLEARRLSAWE